MGSLTATDKRQALYTLPVTRLRDLADGFELQVADRQSKDEVVFALADGHAVDLAPLLEERR